jgi:hypothetical protein
MTLEELNLLLKPEVKEFLYKHLDENPEQFALKYSGKKDYPYRAISEQIFCYNKAKVKLPAFSRYDLFYEKTALEQCSSESTAKFKSSLISGSNIIDLTGGLGIDSAFFAQRMDYVIYCEKNPLLAELFKYNSTQMKIQNITVREGDGPEIIKEFPDNHFDWIYIDPSRRVLNRRTVGLQNCVPNILEIFELLMQKSQSVMIKASPAIEIDEVKKQLRNIKCIYVVSLDNECKEVLIICSRNYSGMVEVSSILINAGSENYTVFSGNENNIYKRNISEKVLRYFYEPDVSIIKSKLTSKISSLFGLNYLNSTVDYLVSDNYISAFPGRIFEVAGFTFYNKNKFKDFLQKNEIESANIARRDFPDAPDTIRKKYKIKEGGSNFLFFTKDYSGKLISVLCRKINK